jgi:hypothetical protein
MFNSLNEARAAFRANKQRAEDVFGIYALDSVQSYTPDAFKNKNRGYSMAMDAQAGLVTDPNAGIPWFLLNYIDPDILQIAQAPVKGAEIYGEERKGDWASVTAMFPVVEHAGEVSSYGDYNNSGETSVNTNFPQRQNYLYQAVKQYGELQLARAGEARINWVSEMDASAMNNMRRFENLMYFFGIGGLQNYGGVNDPGLPASLTPAPKAYGGTTWFVGSTLKATPNEVYTDILSLYTDAVNRNQGLVDEDSEMILALSPLSATALKAANSYGVNAKELLEENLPKLKIMTAPQYGAYSSSNPQGIQGGNFAQLIVKELEGKKTRFAGFSEKLRSHPIIRDMSSFKQKITGGGWGVVWKAPVASASMIGI